MANAIADTFVEWSLDRRLEATRNAREFLERQIEEVKADLERSEQALHRFEVENNIVSLDRNMNLVYRQLEELNSSLARTTSERTAKESLYKSIESGDPSTLIEVIEDPLIRELKSEYNRLLVEYSNLSAVFKPEYPPLKQLQAKISGIRNRINEETKKKILALRSDYHQTILKEEGLKKRLEEQEKLAMALNEKSIQYRILEREVQSNKSVYESLLQRLKETDVTGGIKSNPIQVLDHAAVPLAPFKPNIPRNVLLAFLVGLIGAVGIAFVREFFDRSIKTPEEITEKMNLPVLGAIVKLSSSSKKRVISSARLYVTEPGSAFSEAIRTIRTSIVMSSESGDSLHSVLVTSCWPTEGKSTLASNLALSLAFGSNRVLLLEADLRHPSLGRAFGIDRNEPGLSNFLLADAEIEDIIHFTDTPQLFFIPAGSIISSSPSELLQAEKMKRLLDSLKEDFDYVIVDSPPTIGLSDSLVLSKLTDATVLVVSSGITMQRDIVHAVKQLSNVGARLLGVVVNRLDSKHENYYYRYNYYRNSA
jgi:capsular exopolysaccharide synthesis family protein